MEIKEGEEFNVQIEATGKQGDGIAKIDGYTIIVLGSKMNENVRIKIKRAFARYAFAELVQKREEQ